MTKRYKSETMVAERCERKLNMSEQDIAKEIDEFKKTDQRDLENADRQGENLVIDFTHVYQEEHFTNKEYIQYLDMSDIESCTMYCSESAEKEIRQRLEPYGPGGIHFLDNGNYHYVSGFFMEKIQEPFVLVMFDHHSDMQKPMIHDMITCGSWVAHAALRQPMLEQMVIIGPSRQAMDTIDERFRDKVVYISMKDVEKRQASEQIKKIRMDLPAYISIDKDVLDSYFVSVNWDQGNMSVETLEEIVHNVFVCQNVIGVDICGECSLQEPMGELMEDLRENRKINQLLFNFLHGCFIEK